MTRIPWQNLAEKIELTRDERVLQEHGEDASIFVRTPQAVAYPKNMDDIKTALAFCVEHGVPLNFRGAGTSRGGQPLCSGLVLNFRRHMNKILEFNDASGELTVEPGAYYSEVQKFLGAKGRSFPPDPSYHQCTVGGMVANNAAGIHSVKYGGTVEHVAGMEYLTLDGKLHNTDSLDGLAEQVELLLRTQEDLIREDFPKIEKNSAGYNLNRAFDETGKLDLPKLLCGSEGTLAVFTKIRIKSVELPKVKCLAISFFKDLDSALQAALDLRTYNVAACELVDKVLLDLHAKHLVLHDSPKHAKRITGNSYLDYFYDQGCEAVLIHEYDGDTLKEVTERRKSAAAAIAALALETKELCFPEEERLAWDLRRHTSPILNKLEDGKIAIKPLWAVEDVSLPKDKLIPYVAEQKKIFAKHGITCSFFGHAASANLHIDPVELDPRITYRDAEKARVFDLVAEESYALVIRLGGSISGEHGDGVLRTKYLKDQYPKTYGLFAQLKNIFDPAGLLNPGDIVEGG